MVDYVVHTRAADIGGSWRRFNIYQGGDETEACCSAFPEIRRDGFNSMSDGTPEHPYERRGGETEVMAITLEQHTEELRKLTGNPEAEAPTNDQWNRWINRFMSPLQRNALRKLYRLLETLDYPPSLKSGVDFHFVHKNLARRHKDHPNYTKIMLILEFFIGD